MAVSIPIFLSAPTRLSPPQAEVYEFAVGALTEEALSPRALGRSDFPQHDPLTEVFYVARACYGGVIMGFTQVEATKGKIKAGTEAEAEISTPLALPTPWNQIEAGLLMGMRKPLLIFSQDGVSGGVFDQGAFSGYLQKFRPGGMTIGDWEQMRERIRLWAADVRKHFRS